MEIRPSNLLTTPEDISNLVKQIFLKENDQITNRVLEIEVVWKKLENRFINLCASLFIQTDIIIYTYTCYPTTCPLIARDPLNHRIAFPYNSTNNLACYVIAHELLHEFFYHHIYNIYGKKIDLNSREFWNLSEVINVLIMQEKEWVTLFSIEAVPYEIHRKLLSELRPIWEKNKNIQSFVDSYILRTSTEL